MLYPALTLPCPALPQLLQHTLPYSVLPPLSADTPNEPYSEQGKSSPRRGRPTATRNENVTHKKPERKYVDVAILYADV